MKFSRVLFVLVIASVSLAHSADDIFPNKPITIIVPGGPGGASDVLARLWGQFLRDRWKQPVIIVNKPGASGLIGMESLKNVAADGYTLGTAGSSSHASAPHVFKKLPYDPINDFDCVGTVATAGAFAMVSTSSPFKSVADLITYTKNNRDKVVYGYYNNFTQVPAALLKERADIPIEGVSYKAVGTAITDLIGGHIQLLFLDYLTAAGQLSAGKLIPIAVTEQRRHPLLPNVPTLAETYPGFNVEGFVAITAPRGIPKGILTQLNQGLRDAQSDSAFKTAIEKTGATLVSSTPDECRAFILKEIDRWRGWVKAARIEPQ